MVNKQIDKINNKHLSMDPRPYHFEYRRPRLHNPTYQSLKLYESIYQMDGFKKSNPEIPQQNLYNPTTSALQKNAYRQQQPRNTPESEPEQIKRHQSTDIYNGNKKLGNTRYGSKPSRRQSDELNSSLSQYGTNLVNNMTSMQLLDQNRVFEKQQKQFNIISYQPKAYTPRLKNYPRLTLEDKIIEKRGPSQLQ